MTRQPPTAAIVSLIVAFCGLGYAYAGAPVPSPSLEPFAGYSQTKQVAKAVLKPFKGYAQPSRNTGHKPTMQPLQGYHAEDYRQVLLGAQALHVHPVELASVFAKESSFEPRAWGRDPITGKYYFGLAQLGASERRAVGLDPRKHTTVAAQMPKIVRFLKSRGFDGRKYRHPKERQARLYSTILAGSPNASQRLRDGNGTSVAQVAHSMTYGSLRRQGRAWLQSLRG